MGSKTIRRAQSHAVLWIVILLVVSGSFLTAYTYTNGFKGSVGGSPYNPNPITVSSTSAGSGACVTDGTVHVVTSPGPCYNVQQFIQVHLFDNYAGSSLSGWSCTFYTLAAGAWTFAESVTNTGSNGNCVTTGSYSPGTPMYVWACHSSSACASTSYTNQITNYFAPLPPPNGLTIGAGTVSLANVPATSTPTETTNLPLVLLAGDKAASGTPYNCVLKAPNGTAIINSACGSAASATCYLNEAAGTHTCYLGTGTTNIKLAFTLQYQVSFSTTTYPYGLGYASFTPVNNPSRGTLSSGNTMEEKQASGTDFSIPTMLGTTFTKNGQFLSSTDALYYATPSDSSITKTVASDGTVTNVGSSSQSFTVDASSQAAATSGDQTTFTFKFYAYFSVSYYTTNGSVNSEAVTQASTVTLTLQTH